MKFFNKYKILFLVVFLIFLAFVGFFYFNPERFFGLYNFWFQKTNKLTSPIEAPKGEVATYKGFWMPCSFMDDGCQPMNNIDLLKEMGVNIIGIGPKIVINSKGEINHFPMDFMEKRLSQMTNKYYSAQIRIFISPELGFSENLSLGGGEPTPLPKDVAAKPGFLDKYDVFIADLTKLAEKYHVEMFSPMNEPDMKLGNSVASQWAQKILPTIKENYHGKTLWKLGRGDSAGDEVNFRGYDILGIDFTAPGGEESQSIANFPSLCKEIIDGALGWAKRDGVDTLLLTEVGIWGGARQFSNEGKAAIHRIIFEQGQGKVKGFIILDPPPDQDWSMKNTKSSEEIKTWFTKKLE